jgi:hypothetical protein
MIFQPTDLAGGRRTEFLAAARGGLARLRDKDGTSLVMLPERQLELLEALRNWTFLCLRLDEIVAAGKRPTVKELGSLAWLRVFELSDLREFTAEFHEALIAANSDDNVAPVVETLDAWRRTARQLEDPLRRSILLEDRNITDFVEVERPE